MKKALKIFVLFTDLIRYVISSVFEVIGKISNLAGLLFK